MGANIKGKMKFLEVVSEGKEAVMGYFESLEDKEERDKFCKMIDWGRRSKCISGLKYHRGELICREPSLTGLGKIVYEGRKDIIL